MSVTIRLDPEPIPLDTLAVRPVRVTVRGRVVDHANGQRVPFITIRQGDSNATSSNDAGRFILRDVAAGRQTLRAEGFGWLPASVDLDVDRDTAVEIEVDADPITSQRIAAEVEKLAERSRSVGVALRVLGRPDIMESRAPTPIEYLKGRGVPIRDCPGMTGRLCVGQGAAAVWVDEIPSCLEILAAYPNEALERIEVIGSRRNTIRVYTTWFIERMTERKVILQPLTPFDRPFTW